ncbi:MAG: ABC transporter ATP-binding protein [Acetatifactor sp.]
MSKLLELSNLSYSYHSLQGETLALKDISFTVEEGEFVAIVGPSGCGKTTLLSIIAGLLTPEQGFVKLANSENKQGIPPIGYMLQKDHLFEWLSIYKNVTLGLEMHHLMTPEKKVYIDRLLQEYGLAAFRNNRPSELSGGMKQRAALIRTLALEPSLLLLDEPFSALDFQTRLMVADDISKLIRSAGKTMIIITHDLGEAISLADKIIVLSKRPATIARIIPVRLSLEDDSPLAPRNAPEYQPLFNELWEVLSNEETH